MKKKKKTLTINIAVIPPIFFLYWSIPGEASEWWLDEIEDSSTTPSTEQGESVASSIEQGVIYDLDHPPSKPILILQTIINQIVPMNH